MDIRIDTDTDKFKVRACGVITDGERFLIARMGHNKFFCCPGGHIELNEDSATAVVREMKEESGIDTTIEKPIALMENFFKAPTGQNFHELSFYYLLNPVSLKGRDQDFELIENDKGYLVRQEFKWVTPEELKAIDFRPNAIKEKLVNEDFDFQLLCARDN